MRDRLRVYLDQCLRVEVAEALRREGHDVLRAAEVGQDRADDQEIIQPFSEAPCSKRFFEPPGYSVGSQVQVGPHRIAWADPAIPSPCTFYFLPIIFRPRQCNEVGEMGVRA
jgi:hypothetical protein